MSEGHFETPLLHARRLGEIVRLPRLYVKLESANPTGSHKDRAARHLADAALASAARGVTTGSCGNLGVALARACRSRGLACHAAVPARYQSTRYPEMLELGAQVERVPGGYEEAVDASHRFARATGWFDANPDGPAGRVAMDAYSHLAEEILAQCPAEPLSIWLPTGNGTTAAGLFLRLSRCNRPPAICVVSSMGNNAVTASIKAGRVLELDPHSLIETAINEPLVNWRALHAAEAIAAVADSGGVGCEATDDELLTAQHLLLATEGIRATAAAASALAGILNIVGHGFSPTAPHVLIVTA